VSLMPMVTQRTPLEDVSCVDDGVHKIAYQGSLGSLGGAWARAETRATRVAATRENFILMVDLKECVMSKMEAQKNGLFGSSR